MSDYYAIITDAGAALEVAAKTSGTTVNLVDFSVGDGNGSAVTPDPAQTALVNEVYRASISSLNVNIDDNTVLDAQCVIPSEVGGFTVREVGIYADDGTLYAVGNYVDQIKPDPADGLAIAMDIKVELAVSDTATVTLVYSGDEYLTEEQADTLYLRQDKQLAEIAAQGDAAQGSARDNLGLGTGSTYDVQPSPDNPANGTLFVNGQNILVDRILIKTDTGEYALDIVYHDVDGESVPFIQTSGGMNIWYEILEMGERVYSPNNPPPQQDLSGYLQDVQLGAEASQTTHDGYETSKAPAGNVLTGVHSNYNDSNWELDTIFFKPVQEMVDGAYKTIAG